jgi:hypothetical protein
MKHFETDLSPKISKNHSCELCDYHTSKIADLKKHFSTLKHKKRENETLLKQNETDLSSKVAEISEKFQCVCGIVFNSRTTLWRHKKKCKFDEESDDDNDHKSTTDKDLIMMLVKQNTELMEILKNGTNNTTNTNTNTNCMNNNKTFNLQFFLNETCKDAMNITDFVESIKLQLCDLEKMGEVGYIEGLSNIITSNLKVMDVTERPVHCTDKKRETIYIKDDNKWEKEDDNKTKLRKAIKKISSKNFKLMSAYRDKYPGCQFAESKQSDKYNKLMIEALGGEGDNEKEKEDRIIHNISKNVVIDK